MSGTGQPERGAVATGSGPRCAALSSAAGEQMAGTAPRADVWVAVEQSAGWGEAPLTRAENRVRVVMVRGRRLGRGRGAGPPREVRVWVGYSAGTPELRVGTVDRPEQVAYWDLAAVAAGSLRTWGEPDPEPLLLVCANGRRDRCCGHAGGRLADQLWRGPESDRVLTSTHLGGHRFAPTALLLPHGALHGRLDVACAADLLAGSREGVMRADTLRGFSTLPGPAQVAEAHARRVGGYRELAALPVELIAGPDPRRIWAGVAVPDLPAVLEVPLALRTEPTVMACGRDVEPSSRWVVDEGRAGV